MQTSTGYSMLHITYLYARFVTFHLIVNGKSRERLRRKSRMANQQLTALIDDYVKEHPDVNVSAFKDGRFPWNDGGMSHFSSI